MIFLINSMQCCGSDFESYLSQNYFFLCFIFFLSFSFLIGVYLNILSLSFLVLLVLILLLVLFKKKKKFLNYYNYYDYDHSIFYLTLPLLYFSSTTGLPLHHSRGSPSRRRVVPAAHRCSPALLFKSTFLQCSHPPDSGQCRQPVPRIWPRYALHAG